MASSSRMSEADARLRADLRVARKLVSAGPQSLARAKERGDTKAAQLIEGRIAQARAYLACHGQAAGPLPGRAIASTPPAAPAAVADPPSRRTPVPGPSPSPPKGQTPMTTRATTDALWGQAIAELNASDGLTTASPPAAHHDQVSPARRVETGAGVSGTSSATAWNAAVADVNAENGLTPQMP